MYIVALIAAAAGAAFLIAPSAHHRLRWRDHDKEQLLRTANALGLSLAGLIAGLLAWLWYGLPLARDARD
jgi:hypothetical protein